MLRHIALCKNDALSFAIHCRSPKEAEEQQQLDHPSTSFLDHHLEPDTIHLFEVLHDNVEQIRANNHYNERKLTI